MNGKLVRDRIPEIILQNDGKKAHTRKLSKSEFTQELYRKLQEEISEVIEAKNKEEILSEIADVEEVLSALMEIKGIQKGEVVKVQKKKKKERGGFSDRIYLIQ